MQKENHVKTQKEKVVCQPRGGLRWNLIAWFWTSSLQHYDEINFCRLSHPICGTLYGSPNKQVTNTIFWSEITEDLEHPWFLFNQLQSQDIILMGRHPLGNTVQLLKQSIIFWGCPWELTVFSRAQGANTRPAGQTRPPPCFIWPGTLFLPSSSAELLVPS